MGGPEKAELSGSRRAGYVTLRAEDFALDGALLVEMAEASGGKAVQFNARRDRARATVELPKGVYVACTYQHGRNERHGAVWLAIGGKRWEQRPTKYGSVERARTPARFVVAEDKAVSVCLQTREPGVCVDRVVIEPARHVPMLFESQVTRPLKCRYQLYLPRKYREDEGKWPLILYLHGQEECGDDPDLIVPRVPPKDMEYSFGFIVASPQCPRGQWWAKPSRAKIVDALLDHLLEAYRIDEDRVYLTGYGTGGDGTFHLACSRPDRFAAIAPVSGKGDVELAERLKHLPVWMFHGDNDEAVPLQQSQEMFHAVRQHGGNVRFTRHLGAGREICEAVYGDVRLYQWLLGHERNVSAAPPGDPAKAKPRRRRRTLRRLVLILIILLGALALFVLHWERNVRRPGQPSLWEAVFAPAGASSSARTQPSSGG